jgi:hypothetical protein
MAAHLPEALLAAQSANARSTFARRLVAEGLGTALLLAPELVVPHQEQTEEAS